MNDQTVERIIGHLLRAGVILSALIVAVGGMVYLSHHAHEIPDHAVFRGEPKAWSTLSGLFSASTASSGRAIIMSGLLLLILTPVARVAFSLAAFAMERDWTYVAVTTVVLGILAYGLISS